MGVMEPTVVDGSAENRSISGKAHMLWEDIQGSYAGSWQKRRLGRPDASARDPEDSS